MERSDVFDECMVMCEFLSPRTSAIMEEVPVRQNFFRMPVRPLPVSAPPPIAAGAMADAFA